ncbi:MAG TPA: LysM peptidoglycan-binding domain-containing protein [Caulobacteraceae bacterium]|jgi:hypothetical protein|nr:LysM peptidoglycan-binding domain-containing protein [Caulobacteraceae bacterium]
MTRLSPTLCGALAATSLLAACASGPTVVPAPPAPRPAAPVAVQAPPAPVVPPRERIRRAVDLLSHGQPQPARTELTALLAEQPGDRTAMGLIEQIDRDPRALLGERNYPYKIRPGETLSILAERFLGDPLLFYALARYNGIDAPDTAEVGRTLLIPGTPKKAAPPPKTATTPPGAAAPGANVARADQLRRAALDAMHKGAVDRAVALLEQALALDPPNTLIRADLDRGLRIQASLKKR